MQQQSVYLCSCGDFNTAGSTMFLLGIGEILEEWTHKKSVNDLARSMSINAEKVWFVNEDGQEVLISASSVKAGDLIRVHMGNVIPFDRRCCSRRSNGQPDFSDR